MEAEWLFSGKPPTGLPPPAEAALAAVLEMHRESEGQFFSAFHQLIRARPPKFRLSEEDDPGSALSEPKMPAEGDMVREYSARNLFLKLAGEPGALATGIWTIPKGYLGQIYGCSPDSSLLLIVPEGVAEISAGSRLLIDTSTLEPMDGSSVAIVTAQGRLYLVGQHRFASLRALPEQEMVAGRVAANFERTSLA